MRRLSFSIALAIFVTVSSGCTTMHLPSLISISGGNTGDGRSYSESQLGTALRGSDSALAYKRVAEAKAQNAIVLHVPGDQESLRVLPLPEDGQSVFVSDLLRQSGVQEQIGRVHAVLYRSSAESIGGIRMAVNMSPDGNSVRPESDYALRAGDRLEVTKAPPRPLNGMFTSILGL